MSEQDNKDFTGTMKRLANDLVDSIQYGDCLASLDELLESPRGKVYVAIDGERDYQDSLPASRTDGSQKSVGDYITMMGAYYDKALQAWACSVGNEQALHVMRKLAAIAVRCMEEHGAPERVVHTPKPKDPVHFEPSGAWYFYDGTWSDRLGPYGTEDDARKGLKMYCDHLDGKPYKRVPLATFTERKVPRYDDQPGSGNVHASDCATHNEPAIANGDCDCEAGIPGKPFATNINIKVENAEALRRTQDDVKAAHESAMDAYGFVDGDRMEWLDISNEAYREYVYFDGSRYRVDNPKQLNVKRGTHGDSHRIRTKDIRRQGHRGVYVAPGWVAIEWVGHDGKDATAF